jgi:hypothetical protein
MEIKDLRDIVNEAYESSGCEKVKESIAENDEKNGYNSMEEYEKSQIKVDGDILNKLC